MPAAFQIDENDYSGHIKFIGSSMMAGAFRSGEKSDVQVGAMIKTVTFACVHFTVAFTVAYLLTGDVLIGGALALIEPLCNTFAYHIHEKVWARIRGRGPGGGPGALAAA